MPQIERVCMSAAEPFGGIDIMKKVLLISALLAFALAARSANALTVENISVSDTGGGVSVSGEASASGSSDANASVQSVIRSEGSNTNVRVDIQTTADGQVHATSVERTLQGRERLDVSTRASSENVGAETESEATIGSEESAGADLLLFDRLSVFLENIFNFVFFFW